MLYSLAEYVLKWHIVMVRYVESIGPVDHMTKDIFFYGSSVIMVYQLGLIGSDTCYEFDWVYVEYLAGEVFICLIMYLFPGF